MNRTVTKKQQKKPAKSLSYIICAWIGALISLILLIPTGAIVGSDVGSFRSCNVNDSGLHVNTCGKENLNAGDLLILLVFIGTLIVVLCLFTHAWRSSRRSA
jgi:hypothetical protein